VFKKISKILLYLTLFATTLLFLAPIEYDKNIRDDGHDFYFLKVKFSTIEIYYPSSIKWVSSSKDVTEIKKADNSPLPASTDDGFSGWVKIIDYNDGYKIRIQKGEYCYTSNTEGTTKEFSVSDYGSKKTRYLYTRKDGDVGRGTQCPSGIIFDK